MKRHIRNTRSLLVNPTQRTQLNIRVVRKEDILTLNVSVNDSVGVEVRQTLEWTEKCEYNRKTCITTSVDELVDFARF